MSSPAPRVPALERWGRFAVRRHRWILAFGAVALVVLGVVGAGALNALSLSRIDAPGSESDQARILLEEQFGTGYPNLTFLVTTEQGSVDDPDVRAAGEQLTAGLAAEDGVSSAASYWTRGDSPALRGEDGRQAIVLVRVPGEVNAARERVGELAAEYAGDHGPVTVAAGGQDEVFREIGAQSRTDFVRAELIVIPMVALLLIVFYRRVALSLVTLGVGVFSIVGTLAALRGVAAFTSVSMFAANIALVMGLALGVDYCLFLIARFREELERGRTVADAVVTAVRTAGRTVLFSGLTVAISLLALLLFPLPFLRSFGYGGAFVVVSAVVGALVILPAALTALGHRAARRAPRDRPVERGAWYRLAHAVMRRPALTGGLLLAVVLALSAPVAGLRFGMPDARILPADSSSRATADEIRANFVQEESDALYAVVPSTGDGDVAGYAEALSEVEGIAQVDAQTGTYRDGTWIAEPGDGRFDGADDGTYLVAIPAQAALEDDAADLVERVRAVPVPFSVLIGGTPAEMADWRGDMTERMPLVLATILVLTFVILFLMTGSVVLPLKATVLNLLSMGVMFGVLVWVFQEGNGADLLGFTATGRLESSIPILMFCIVYGLSMDYEVFIVSRIREEYLRSGDSRAAVPLGLQRSAPLITTAAVILAASFAVYATGGVVYLKMIGVGMAVAVVVDALLIRGVLLPAFMLLAGRANWWAPAPLRRLHSRFGLVEGEPHHTTTPGAEPVRAAVTP